MTAMETLQASIAATCPSAFTGVSGNLFIGAVTAVVAAHCTIFGDYQWPEDKAYKIIREGQISYNFIIVGAGTAGSLLAGRLSALYPSKSVLLIEAGDDPKVDSEVPFFLSLNRNNATDWNYLTTPDGSGCLGLQNQSCVWSKGRGLGGSSSLNAMLYIRGHPEDYNEWRELGNEGWSYDDLLPYFVKIEKELTLNEYSYNRNPWYDLLDKAWLELGYVSRAANGDENSHSNEAHIGTRITKLLVRNGKRLNTAKIYLKGFKNLHVMKNTVVQKILIDPKTKITTGVEVRHDSGVVMQILASKEVILSAGSIASPQILMLSGIGPEEHLREKNIECLKDLPVGKNLHDHVFFPLLLRTNQNLTLSSEAMITYLLQYMLTRTGPISTIGITDYMGFINTKGVEGRSDVQYHHVYFTRNENMMLKHFYQNIGLHQEIIESIVNINKGSDLLGIYPSLLHPKSRGEILLRDSDPQSRPVIKANYFQDREDIETLTRAINFVHVLENTETFKFFGLKIAQINLPGCSHLNYDTEHYWECYIRHLSTTIYHAVGTVKMGPYTDETSVVDHNLMVHGIKNLRVVDASIMPKIPGANTMATTLVIAEKAFDIIRNHYDNKDEL